jgi:hypothetical protein
MNKENIIFFLNDNIDIKDKNIDLNELMENFEMEKFNLINNNNNINIVDEELIDNYLVTDLLKICEYYALSKNIKMAKYKKQEIIDAIYLFENDIFNNDIVEKRKRLWKNIKELSEDKIMKKYIIWK